jgi:hypothetical protein
MMKQTKKMKILMGLFLFFAVSGGYFFYENLKAEQLELISWAKNI